VANRKTIACRAVNGSMGGKVLLSVKLREKRDSIHSEHRKYEVKCILRCYFLGGAKNIQ
jgi:hypothetical protein